MTLYEINQKILDAVAYGCDPETGEIVDSTELDALQMAKDEKIENILLLIKDMRAEQAALKNEIDALSNRMRSTGNRETWLVNYVGAILDGDKYKSSKCSVSYRKSQSVNVFDPESLPEEYFRVKVTKEPNKIALKDALKSGEEIPGAVLEDCQSMIIK